MTKESGLAQLLCVGGSNLSGDVGSIENLSSPRGEFGVTGLDKSARERLLLRGDGQLAYTAFFNDAAGQAHAELSPRPTTDVHVLYGMKSTRGKVAAMLTSKQMNYDPTRGGDGALTISTQKLADGIALEWGELLTAGVETIASAGQTDSVNAGAASSNGLAAMLQVISIASGSITAIDIQSSSDDGAGDAFADIASFTQFTAGSTERITLSGAIEQYLRLDIAGTFTNAVIAVAVRRGTAQDDTPY
jgi:hypothetical protein